MLSKKQKQKQNSNSYIQDKIRKPQEKPKVYLIEAVKSLSTRNRGNVRVPRMTWARGWGSEQRGHWLAARERKVMSCGSSGGGDAREPDLLQITLQWRGRRKPAADPASTLQLLPPLLLVSVRTRTTVIAPLTPGASAPGGKKEENSYAHVRSPRWKTSRLAAVGHAHLLRNRDRGRQQQLHSNFHETLVWYFRHTTFT